MTVTEAKETAVELEDSSDSSSENSNSRYHTDGGTSLLTPVTPSNSESKDTTEFKGSSLHCATQLSANDDPSNALSKQKTKSGSSSPSTSTLAPEILAVGDLLDNMKRTLVVLNSTFDMLATQTERAATLGPAIKATNQLTALRKEMESQIEKQQKGIEQLKTLLEEKIKLALENDLKAHVKQKVDDLLPDVVGNMIRNALQEHIPPNLQQVAQTHERRRLNIQAHLINSEARRFNSTLQPGSKVFLRPLQRPFPDSESDSDNPENLSDLVKPSAIFPETLAELFNLNAEKTKILLKEYGIVSTDDPKGVDSNIAASPNDLNRFMAHIGVCYRVRNAPSSALGSQTATKLGPRIITATDVR